jgi:carbon storage regulator
MNHPDREASSREGESMLVLTRRVGETVVIDGDIRVTVVAIQGDKIRLGFVAPESVTVDREEIHQRRGSLTEAVPHHG